MAKEPGWARCFNCQAMVELTEGFNHINCPCGAQFCIICGSKRQICDCPPRNYRMKEGEFDHVQIPIPMVSRERLGGLDGVPRGLRSGLGYPHESRRHRGHPDEDRSRRLQYAQEEEDDEADGDDGYLHDTGDVMGMGNPAGHFLNEDYRRRSQSTVVPPAPPPPVPLPPASASP
ncbi:hypothetical protein NUW58_g9543 [Xylaria curta]|uniref:Uncharacterized protein n=1 Tax=Xylaria curta TaxID=42375 RepID=A0ACC1MXK3_9PEZI|nr:hypothetical protein NUW58_g9543 [Xylaria curta]